MRLRLRRKRSVYERDDVLGPVPGPRPKIVHTIVDQQSYPKQDPSAPAPQVQQTRGRTRTT